MEKVTSEDGTILAFERTGTRPALILVDGAMCFRGFGPMGPLAALLPSRFTVYTYDRRGRGDSADTEPYTIGREVDDLRALIEVAGGSASAYGVSSGAVLLLHAAASGLALPKLALFEPPLQESGSTRQVDLAAELARLVAGGRRGDAVELFQTEVGIPAELIAGMRQAPFRPVLEGIAPTLVYDTTIIAGLALSGLAAITTPTLWSSTAWTVPTGCGPGRTWSAKVCPTPRVEAWMDSSTTYRPRTWRRC